MNDFKVGDKVRTNIARREAPIGSVGTLTRCDMIRPGEVCVEFPSEITTKRYFYLAAEGQVEHVDPRPEKFVNVIESRTIWVTLPGDNAGHKLSEDDAQALFRQLEEIL